MKCNITRQIKIGLTRLLNKTAHKFALEKLIKCTNSVRNKMENCCLL